METQIKNEEKTKKQKKKNVLKETKESDELSKTQKQKIEKKTNKKMAKAVNVIQHHEKKSIEQLFTTKISNYLWVYHFGNGDEDDQIGLYKHFSQFGPCKVYVFPGISYGYLEFENIENINFDIINNLENKKEKKTIITNNEEKIENQENNIKEEINELIINNKDQDKIENINEQNTNNNETTTKDKSNKKEKFIQHKPAFKANAHNVVFPNGERTIFTFFTYIKLENVVINKESTFPNANYKVDIKGLYVIDDFITEEEEDKLIKIIDDQKWNKLSNRRVQHYGYEFIYGSNNINKNNKVGELPEFLDFVMESNNYNLYY
jgi:hypothetical protein